MKTFYILIHLFLILLLSGNAFANTWPNLRHSKGEINYELNGLADTSITAERLDIELTETEYRNAPVLTARIRAEYDIFHIGKTRDIDLEFISGSSHEYEQVTFDGKILPSRESPHQRIPWRIPEMFPALNGKLTRRTAMDENTRGFVFTAGLSPGTHTLVVEYTSPLASYSFSHTPVQYHQFLYVLAPAKAWKDFGDLLINIRTPENFIILSSPPLEKARNHYTGQFTGIPSDFLTISAVYENNYDAVETTGNIIAFSSYLLLLVSILYLRRKSHSLIGKNILALFSFLPFFFFRGIGASVITAIATFPEYIGSAYLLSYTETRFTLLRWFLAYLPCLLIAGFIEWLTDKRIFSGFFSLVLDPLRKKR